MADSESVVRRHLRQIFTTGFAYDDRISLLGGRLRSMGRGRTRTAPPSQAPGAAPAAAVAPAAPPATPPETPGDGSRGKTPGRGIGKPMEGEEEQDPDREKGSPSSAGTGDGKDVSPERVTRDKLKDLQVVR